MATKKQPRPCTVGDLEDLLRQASRSTKLYYDNAKGDVKRVRRIKVISWRRQLTLVFNRED